MHVNGSSAAVIVVSPNSRQQNFTGEYLTGVLGQKLQQLVYQVSQVKRPTVNRCLVGLEVESQPAVINHIGLDA